MATRPHAPLALLVTLLWAAWVTPLHAAGINHFQAAAGAHNYLVTNHPAVLPHLKPSTWLLSSYARNPLVCRDASGNAAYAIVEHQVSAELAAALGLFDRLEIAAVLPGTYLQGPPLPQNPRALCGAGTFAPEGLREVSFADPRLMAKVLLTPWNEGFVASFRLSSDMPLAQLNPNVRGVAGELFPNLTPALTLGFSHPWLRFAIDAGYLLRSPTRIGDLQVGHEVQYGAAAELNLIPRTLALTLDVFGKAAPAALFGSRDQFPLEGASALKVFLGNLVVVAGAGSGVVADYGSPELRFFAGIGYHPQAPRDRDGDGILDPDDACPDFPEDRDGYRDEDGCPDPDNDQDRIPDDLDRCPDEPEDRDRWQDRDGCPDPDNDGDRILDEADECPNDPEVYNGFEDEDGCPDSRDDDANKVVVVVRREKIEIREKVFFAYDSDRILPQSYGLLDNVAQVINAHPEIVKIRIEGHSDADGRANYNRELSDRRAKSVLRYLVAAGVDAGRLDAVGYGEAQPIASNRDEEGKAKNRRVEFVILDEDGAAIPRLVTQPRTPSAGASNPAARDDAGDAGDAGEAEDTSTDEVSTSEEAAGGPGDGGDTGNTGDGEAWDEELLP